MNKLTLAASVSMLAIGADHAFGQAAQQTPNGQIVNTVATWCASNSGTAAPCASGGGGSVTIAAGGVAAGAYLAGSLVDGAITTMGSTTDTAWTTGAGSLIALGKATVNALNAALPAGTNTIGTVSVSGTSAVSAASLPLPSGAATAANQTNVQSAAGTSAATALGVQGVTGGIAVPVSGSVTASVSGTPTVLLASGSNIAGSVKVTDGTNTAAVKAASTAAAATDPAAVVSISPNSALPAGANSIGTVADSSVNNASVAVGGATAPTNTLLTGCRYNSGYTLTGTQVGELQCSNGGLLLIAPQAVSSGGASMNLQVAASTNDNMALRVANGQHTLYMAKFTNGTGAAAYFHIYNSATTPPVVGTTAQSDCVVVAAGTSVTVPYGTAGVNFGSGIGTGVTTGSCSATDTAIVNTAGSMTIFISYK